MRFIRSLSRFLSLAVMSIPQASFAEPGEQITQKLDARVQVEMDYLLYVPANYDAERAWPLVLFLHGAGERGRDLHRVEKHGPPKLAASGKVFPFLLVSPQCIKDRSWEPVDLTALLDHVVKSYSVDEDRIYVTGLSMGGFGTWRLAAYTPDRFAAIAPVCGGGEPFWAKLIKDIPTWAFHGALDTVVPPERSQQMVDEIKKQGGDPKLTIYPDAKHDSWTETYDNAEFYEWLLSQKRSRTDR